MSFTTPVPNNSPGGARPQTGGAVPGPLSRAAEPAIPNESPGGDRKRDEGAKAPAEAGFLSPPNMHAPAPGFGGKM